MNILYNKIPFSDLELTSYIHQIRDNIIHDFKLFLNFINAKGKCNHSPEIQAMTLLNSIIFS